MRPDQMYKIAIDRWGREAQMGMMQEECAELIQAISKVFRKGMNMETIDHAMEEMVDVEIMLEQMKIVFRCDGLSHYSEIRERKLSRLAERLGETLEVKA